MDIKCLLLTFFVSISFTYGCATKYQPQGFKGGYSEVQFQPDVFDVHFKGNGYTSPEAVEKMLMYRCAELTINNGYDYFVIADSKGDSAKSVIPIGKSYKVVEKPREQCRIKLYKGQKPEENPNAFDPGFIINSIGPQIGIRQSKD